MGSRRDTLFFARGLNFGLTQPYPWATAMETIKVSPAPVPLLLAPTIAQTYADDPSSVYAVTADLRIAYVNPGWHDFARANEAKWQEGEWGVGSCVMDAVPAILRPFYEQLFAEAFASGEIVEHDYECPSPKMVRNYRMRILPSQSPGLVIVHNVPLGVREHVLPCIAPDSLYLRSDGLILQCSHCRQVRRARSGAWDWVPEFVKRPRPNISHGLCPSCTDYHYQW